MRALLRLLAPLALVVATLAAPSVAQADDGDRQPLGQFGSSKRSVENAASKALRAVKEARTASVDEDAPPNRDYTLKLRDLRLLRGELSGSERAEADRLLARPTTLTAATDDEGWPPGSVVSDSCLDDVCVHYLRDVDPDDGTNDNNPNVATDGFAGQALGVAQSVLDKYTAAGYRAPESDATSPSNGGDAKLDVYLSDIGPELYGYCTSDDPKTDPSNNGYDVSAYCVIDNDYSSSQFPGNALALMQVTLAHELFHAVQFAYDSYEDGWFMEATATWVEDELYDDVNDNRNYLSVSPLKYPSHSLDLFEDYDSGSTYAGFQYGAWTFFRYLSERYPTKSGDLPSIVRKAWEIADGSTANAARDADSSASIYAVASALKTVDSRPFRTIFSEFSARNRHPKDVYEEGSAWTSYVGAPRSTYGFSLSKRSRDWTSVKLSQLSSQTIQYKASGLSASNWKLKISLALPKTEGGSAATVLVFRKSGTVKTYPVTVWSSGKANQTVEFSTASVSKVQLVLSNASTRYTCWQPGSMRSCLGTPQDNGTTYKFKASVFRG